mgnify:CR=1 FL=1
MKVGDLCKITNETSSDHGELVLIIDSEKYGFHKVLYQRTGLFGLVGVWILEKIS